MAPSLQGCRIPSNTSLKDSTNLQVVDLRHPDSTSGRCETRSTVDSTVGSRQTDGENTQWNEGIAGAHLRFKGDHEAYNAGVSSYFKEKDCAPLLGRVPRTQADVGECALLAGDLSAAYHSLMAAVLAKDAGASTYYHLALAYARLGMHQAAEGSFWQAVRAGGRGSVFSELSSLLLERAHLEAAKRPSSPEGAVASQVRQLCTGNGFDCHASGMQHTEVWTRDGIPLELVRRWVFTAKEASVPRAKVYASDDERAVIGAGLEYELVDRGVPVQGLYTARFHNMRLGAGGLMCNGTHVVSTSRLRRPHADDLASNPICTGDLTPLRKVRRAMVLFERWGTQWQHFMQATSHEDWLG